MIETLKYISGYVPHNERNQFFSCPRYKPLDDGVRWQLEDKMSYCDPWGKMINVPKEFVTDFASIPDLSRIALYVQLIALICAKWFPVAWFIFTLSSVVIYIAESFLHEGTWDNQSCLHDFIFATRCRNFFVANWILYVSMKAKGAAITPTWKRVIIFLGVMLGGYAAWINDARKLRNRNGVKFIAQAQLKNKS
jgi:hypothetical protein